ncbi:MAG: recombinase family protein [Ruminococcaceae bacterium]|nr:recombinase family protein [Oscillospiraceae bacterium]
MVNTKYAEILEQSSMPKKVWKTALYLRLSRDDGDKAESNSIASQREILKEYVKQRPDMEIHDIYVDDGYSGTNFDRPDFNRMMDDIYAGKVNCVIVKDLSRFARNHTEGGTYLDKTFVKLGVRFIAINNQIDIGISGISSFDDLIKVGITNLMNEGQAATTSVNVRGTLNLRRQQGKFIGSFPTYGYLKDPDDKHHLIIDEETAPIVRMIFERFIAGESIIGITKNLNEMGIPNPSMYKKQKGYNYKHPSGRSNDGLWPDSSVRRILQNRMYLGDMVQGRNTTYSYKIKQCRAIPKDEWIVVEGTHEPIIDQETFDNAQALFNKHIRKSPKKNNVDLFSGLVRCADCKRIMNKKTNQHSYGTYHYYRCVTSRKLKKSACTNHTIRIDKLEEAVLLVVQNMINTAITMSDMLEKINSNSKRKIESTHIQKALSTASAEREKLVTMIADLYPDWKSGAITQDEYQILKERLNEKLSVVDEKIVSLNKSAEQFKNGITEENDFVAHFKKHGNIEYLTRPLLTELVEEIFVNEGGDIEVVFKFRDAYAQVTEYIELNKELIEPQKRAKKKKTA